MHHHVQDWVPKRRSAVKRQFGAKKGLLMIKKCSFYCEYSIYQSELTSLLTIIMEAVSGCTQKKKKKAIVVDVVSDPN